MFVPPESLPFDMAALIAQTLAEWHEAKPPATPSPESEGVGDFIVAELNRSKLRQFDGLVALFDAEASPERYGDHILIALELWLADLSRKPATEPPDSSARAPRHPRHSWF